MPSAASLLSSTPPKILIYGPPGTSKTISVMTLGERLELLDCDRGFASGVTLNDNWTKERQKVEVVPCHDSAHNLADGFEKAKNRMLMIQAEITQKKYRRQVVCLDTITTFGESCMKYFLLRAGRWGNGQAIQIQDYGMAVNYAQQILGLMRSLPVPIICIAHDYTKNVNNADVTRVVAIGDKMSSILPSFFDEVWYMRVTGVNQSRKYQIQTMPSSTLMCRSRRNLPDMTDTSVGMVEIFKKLGWEFPPLEPEGASNAISK